MTKKSRKQRLRKLELRVDHLEAHLVRHLEAAITMIAVDTGHELKQQAEYCNNELRKLETAARSVG
jgi:hypothetical protein